MFVRRRRSNASWRRAATEQRSSSSRPATRNGPENPWRGRASRTPPAGAAGARLSDRTARAFAEQFYDALCRGKTVFGRPSTVATAVDEKGAYLLLPAGACYKHDTVICDSSEESQGAQIETPRLCPVRGPAPPERLAGRNDAVAEVVRLIGFERRRCVTVRGARGGKDGRGARAAAAFLADRATSTSCARWRSATCRPMRRTRTTSGCRRRGATTPSSDELNARLVTCSRTRSRRSPVAAHAGGAPRPGPHRHHRESGRPRQGARLIR